MATGLRAAASPAALAARLSALPAVSKILFVHGLLDVLFPNPTTAAPLLRVVDRQFQSKKKRGWAWLFLMCGLMKVRGAFADAPSAACVGGWAYGMQALAMTAEGFLHKSIPRPEKVLVSTICFCAGMWAWLQVAAWRHARAALAPALPKPSAPPLEAPEVRKDAKPDH